MKILLSGYEKSKIIIPVSSYLISKFLKGFDVYFLNYGEYVGELNGCKYVNLKEKQESVHAWSKDLQDYIKTLDDERIIFSLDDYLLERPIDMELYEQGLREMTHICNIYSGCNMQDEVYTVTTQYIIWNKEILLEVLEQVRTPWEFELLGSAYANKNLIKSNWRPALKYDEHSALSGRWEGIKTYNNKLAEEYLCYHKIKDI